MIQVPTVRPSGALVIGGDYRGLGIVRSLGRRGIPVWVLSDQHRLAGFSRYCARALKWPVADDDRRVEFLLELAARHGLEGWAIFPTADATASLLSRHHERLSERYCLTVPPWDEFLRVYDKWMMHRLAVQLGIDQPLTAHPRNRDELAALDFTFPVILKPSRKEGAHNPFVHDKAWRIESKDELIRHYDQAREAIDPDLIMVQEMIPGLDEDYAFAALCLSGQPLVSLVAWRSRQYPVEFGRASTYVETVERWEVEEPARRFLAAIEYTGIVQVGFKVDPRDGRYKLLDVNPRAWGSHTLGRRAGADFIYSLWRLISGEAVFKVKAPTGLRWLRLSTDVLAASQMIRRGHLSPGGYLRSLRGPMEFAILALDDPVPALVDLPLLLHLAWKRGAI